jgi:PAS domain S-box-containing protein
MATVPASQLRADAEAELARNPPKEARVRFSDELLHELQVHQIELEMQNESLRQSQVALEESRDRYVDLYEFAPLGYLSLDPNGLIRDINLTGANILGEERGKLRQRRFSRFVVPEDQDKWRRHFIQSLRQDGKDRCELSLRRSDGRIIHARLDSLLSTGNDESQTLRVALTDISDLKQAMLNLRASETRLRLAKNAAGLGIYDRNFISGKLEWDERAREIWGFAPDDATNIEQIMSALHPDDLAATKAKIEQACDPQGSGEFNAEFRVISRADGNTSTVAAAGQVFFEAGHPVRAVGVVKDISARKLLEKEGQERRSEMELLVNQQVAAQTAAAIAHELNQPLISISAYSDAALRMLKSGIKQPEKLVHALEGAMDQAQRAGKNLHELLAFLHQGEAIREPTDINSVVREALAMAAESGYGGFRSVVELEEGLRPVLANRLQMQKVLVNLLHNGVEAMRNAGVPKAAIIITVRTHGQKDMALVTVQDNGPGLDVEAAQKIFEPFYTTKPRGMGLGLAISRALVEAHGGRLWANPDAGPGATFHFTVPFAP